jgi:cytochrome P450
MAAYRAYLRGLVDAKALEPGDDLTSDLIAIHRENPERLTLEEIASILFSLSFAGHETTTGLIGNTVRRLLEVPGRWSSVVRDRGLIPAAVEETLRYDPSVPVWRRVTTRPVTLAGVDLPAGARLFLWLAAAGRDPAAFSRPDAFDLGRADSARHLAFGRGLHYCLGANLGRLETQIAVGALADRYPRLRLGTEQPLTFHPNISFRGPQRLLVRPLLLRGEVRCGPVTAVGGRLVDQPHDGQHAGGGGAEVVLAIVAGGPGRPVGQRGLGRPGGRCRSPSAGRSRW